MPWHVDSTTPLPDGGADYVLAWRFPWAMAGMILLSIAWLATPVALILLALGVFG